MIRLLWKKTSDGAKIYRVYGTNGCLTVPQKIEGMPVYAIGAYCFSASNKLDGLEGIRETKWQESLELYCEKTYDGMVEAQPGTRDGVQPNTREVAQPAAAYLGEIAGNEVLQVVLPDTVVEIEELAFYNCRKLSVIEFGSALETIGSDVFMNCRSLKQLRVRADIRGKTGVKAVLSRIPWEIQVDFAGERRYCIRNIRRVMMKLRRRIFLGVILPEKDFGQDSNFKMVLYSLPDMMRSIRR